MTSTWGPPEAVSTGREYVCAQRWPWAGMERAYFLAAIFVTCYSIPLVCISVCYALIARRVCNRGASGIHDRGAQSVVQRSKVKVIKMLVTVVVVFTFSWLPLYVVHLRLYYGPPIDTSSVEFSLLIQVIMPVIQWAGSANSCVNPFIYCFFSNKFRAGFKQLFAAGCCCCCRRDSDWLRNTDRTTSVTACSFVPGRRDQPPDEQPSRRGAVRRTAASQFAIASCAAGGLPISAKDLTFEATCM